MKIRPVGSRAVPSGLAAGRMDRHAVNSRLSEF